MTTRACGPHTTRRAARRSLKAERSLHGRLHAALRAAQRQRPQRGGWATQADGTRELDWVIYERNVIHTAVNRERATRGLPPVDRIAVLQVELQAYGHANYTDKYVLGCRELVLSQDA